MKVEVYLVEDYLL